MDVLPLKVFAGWLLVFLGCEAGQALAVEIQPEGVGAAEEDVDPQVELEPV